MNTAQFLNQTSIVLYWFCFAAYTAYWGLGFTRWKLRFYALLGFVFLHIAAIALRGISIEYFPLTNKFESFNAFAAATFIILLIYARTESHIYRMSLFGVGYGFFAAAALFPKGISYAPPLMLTIWYVLHVPLSFFCYALWVSATAAAVARYFTSGEKKTYDQIIDAGFQYGLIAFSISMIFGGLWGYVAWGAYFLWDAKVVWSVIIWFFYATCLHLDYWQEAKQFKPPMAILGFIILMMTYVGTSFFIGSSHSFR
ncbi:MAG: cytochrome c biogenesis protein CcsA [Candidatus Brocadia sp.]|jgi:ABC-type transport system involved in cytochrome c biogenesis permease subunit